jgi:hypothetical protein
MIRKARTVAAGEPGSASAAFVVATVRDEAAIAAAAASARPLRRKARRSRSA